MSVYDVLKERGFLKQLSHEDEIKELLGDVYKRQAICSVPDIVQSVF